MQLWSCCCFSAQPGCVEIGWHSVPLIRFPQFSPKQKTCPACRRGAQRLRLPPTGLKFRRVIHSVSTGTTLPFWRRLPSPKSPSVPNQYCSEQCCWARDGLRCSHPDKRRIETPGRFELEKT